MKKVGVKGNVDNRTTLADIGRACGRSAALIGALVAVGCDAEPPARRAPPAEKPPPAAGICSASPAHADPANVALFPQKTGEFCLDPEGSDKGYGEGTNNPLDGICDLFDGECELYKRHNVTRVVESRYVNGAGKSSTIDVKLSKFSDDTHAFAMFTMRTVGSEDPAHPDAPRKIDGGGMAALGIGNAYLWRGPYLAEILYNDPSASVGAITKQADTLLPAFVKTLGEKLPGDKSLPAAAALLPGEHRLPLGVRYVTKNLLYVDGVGPGAYGFYQNGTARWRVVSAIREHWEATHQTLVAIREDWKGKAEKGIGEAAVLAVQEASGADGEWLIARQGRYLLGVGDEPRVLRAGMPIDERQKKTLSREAKRELLAKLLAPLAQAKTPPSP